MLCTHRLLEHRETDDDWSSGLQRSQLRITPRYVYQYLPDCVPELDQGTAVRVLTQDKLSLPTAKLRLRAVGQTAAHL